MITYYIFIDRNLNQRKKFPFEVRVAGHAGELVTFPCENMGQANKLAGELANTFNQNKIVCRVQNIMISGIDY